MFSLDRSSSLANFTTSMSEQLTVDKESNYASAPLKNAALLASD